MGSAGFLVNDCEGPLYGRQTANGWARATEASEGREPLRRGGAVRERSQTPLVVDGGIRYQLLRRIRFRMDLRSLMSQTPFVAGGKYQMSGSGMLLL